MATRERLGTLVSRKAERAFVGREQELEFLDELARGGDETRVVQLHGVAGIGKSALLDAFLERARHDDVEVVRLDCRSIEPTERGFLEALGRAAGGSPLDADTMALRLGTLGDRVVLALDQYEVFRLMDTWLRQAFVPALGDQVRVVLAGREAPVAGWFSVGWEGLFRSLPLGALGEPEAELLLERRGFEGESARRLNRIARGHPLALTLASAAVVERPEIDLEEAATGRVVSELARLYLEDVDDAVTREALEAAAVVRRTTQPLLRAMLPDVAPQQAFERLLTLPFTELASDGLFVHDAVRDALSAYLSSTDASRHSALRRAAWRQLRTEVGVAAPADLWRYTADMLYLIANPVVREAFFPSGAQPLAVEPAVPSDGAAIEEIAAKHDSSAAADLIAEWWRATPDSFSVVRDRDGTARGFFLLLDTTTILRPPVDDPVVNGWRRHIRDHPLPDGQLALGLRRWLDVDEGEAPCPTQAACWLDVKRTYMTLRPELRRIYVTVRDVPTYWPVVERLGFRPLPAPAGPRGQQQAGELAEPVSLGDRAYASVSLDFGPGSVDGWLTRLVGAELGLAEDAALDEEARELTLDGGKVSLTPLEFGVLRELDAAAGKAVGRGELLREVWGTDFQDGSNVVDVVVRSLRRKLGPHADLIETVRGIGYRLRAGWRGQLS